MARVASAIPDALGSQSGGSSGSRGLLFEGEAFLHGTRHDGYGVREGTERTAAIRRGDVEVLEAVVREVLPGLLRAARTGGLSADRAEDAVQECMLVFLRRRQDFDGRARVSTWIYGILMHKIAEGRRDLRRDDSRDDIDDVVEARFNVDGSWARPPHGPGEDLARGEVERLVSHCLEGVPERQRLAFVLREIEGFETEEICNILQVSGNNLGVLLYRARNRLRECLETKGMHGVHDAEL